MFNDNRDLPVANLRKKEKYHPHIKSAVDVFVKRFPQKGNVVDVGCRDGYAVELFANCGYTAIGTDLMAECVEYAKEKKRNVIIDDITNTKLAANNYDYVFSRHCLEHCRSTELFIEGCLKILKPSGHLFLTFPMETYKEWKSRNKKDHMVYIESKDVFRSLIKNYPINTMILGKSKHYNIVPEGRELLFVGQKYA